MNKITLIFKGFTAVIEDELDAGELFGRTFGMRDMITFQGKTIAEASKSFEESVDLYLSCCLEEKRQPSRSYLGHLRVEIAPDLHRKLAILAEARGQSIRELISCSPKSVVEGPAQVSFPEPTRQEVKAKLQAGRPKTKPASNRRGATRHVGVRGAFPRAKTDGSSREKILSLNRLPRKPSLIHFSVVRYSSRSATCCAVRSRSRSSGMSERDWGTMCSTSPPGIRTVLP